MSSNVKDHEANWGKIIYDFVYVYHTNICYSMCPLRDITNKSKGPNCTFLTLKILLTIII